MLRFGVVGVLIIFNIGLSRIVDVSIFEYGFAPNPAFASYGDTVRWTNVGNLSHTTTDSATNGQIWDSLLPPGGTFLLDTRTIPPGYHPYFCRQHRFMRGLLICLPGPIRDVEVEKIIYPIGIVGESTQVIPRAKVVNNGDVFETLTVFFQIEGGAEYDTQAFISILPKDTIIVSFPPYLADLLGWLDTYCDAELFSDWWPFNNDVSDSILVVSGKTWYSLPPIENEKPVKSGGRMVWAQSPVDAGDLLFAFKGNNTNTFMAFDISAMTWDHKESIPFAPGSKKRVKKGAALTWDRGDTIYAIKGNNTLDFWAYSISQNRWFYKGQVPPGQKKIKGGSGLAYIRKGDSDFVFLMKGAKTQEFYAYYRQENRWLGRATLPAPMADGSSLARGPGDSIIYALGYVKSEKINALLAYNVNNNTWTGKTPMPLIGRSGKKKKIKDGGCMTFDDTVYLYALKAGKTQEFWKYKIDVDDWLQEMDVPLLPSGKPVGPGAGITFVPSSGPIDGRGEGEIYILKGNNTDDVYTMPVDAEAKFSLGKNELGETDPETGKTPLLYPSILYRNQRVILKFSLPISIKGIKFYNSVGKLVKTLKNSQTSVLLELSSGIYFARIDTENGEIISKIIVR